MRALSHGTIIHGSSSWSPPARLAAELLRTEIGRRAALPEARGHGPPCVGVWAGRERLALRQEGDVFRFLRHQSGRVELRARITFLRTASEGGGSTGRAALSLERERRGI